MGPIICSVTYEIDAQNHRPGQFTVPMAVCDILGLEPGDAITLVIRTPKKLEFEVTKPLASGTEIYGPDIAEHVEAGARLRVTASRPAGS